MMNFPASHYPISGIQHTRAVIALTAIQACLEMFKPQDKSSLGTHLKSVQANIDKCREQTIKRRLSQGAKRDLSRAFDVLGEYVTNENMDKNESFTRWSALVWTALTFIEDVNNTCPIYASGANARAWRDLQKEVDALADRLCDLEHGIDEQGTYIYERAAWALDGVDYTPPQNTLLA